MITARANAMRSLLILLVILVHSTHGTASKSCRPNKWAHFKQRFNKSYENKFEDEARYSIFCKNLRSMGLVNQYKVDQLNVHQFLDWTQQEMHVLRNGFEVIRNHNAAATSGERLAETMIELGMDFNSKLPTELDWSNNSSRVSRVRDQGKCQSSWAIGVAGLLEGQENLYQDIVALSEQNLIDCDANNDGGCSGGLANVALDGIRERGGLMSLEQYAHSTTGGGCKMNASQVFATTKNLGDTHLLPAGNERLLKRMLANYGPILIGVRVKDDFLEIMDDRVYERDSNYDDDKDLKQIMLLVGYGVNKNGIAYWKVKNSWGEVWAQRGYAFMARDKENNSKISDYAWIVLPKTN